MVRRQDGEGFAQVVLDEAFDGRERMTLGRYDSSSPGPRRWSRSTSAAWRESSGLWDRALARRAKLAKRLGLVAGLGGIALAVVGGLAGTTAGPRRSSWLASAPRSASPASASRSRSGARSVLSPEGTAAWLQVESLRLYLTRSRRRRRRRSPDRPARRVHGVGGRAERHGANGHVIASRIADTTRTAGRAGSDRQRECCDQFYWLRHANIGRWRSTTSCARVHLPAAGTTSASSSGGSSYSGGYRSSSSSRVGRRLRRRWRRLVVSRSGGSRARRSRQGPTVR